VQDQPGGVHEDVPFASIDFPGTVDAAGAARLTRLDAQVVENAHARRRVASDAFAEHVPQLVVHVRPDTEASPATGVEVTGGPGWGAHGEHLPGAASAEQGLDGIDESAAGPASWSALAGGWWEGFEERPFSAGQIRVAPASLHASRQEETRCRTRLSYVHPRFGGASRSLSLVLVAGPACRLLETLLKGEWPAQGSDEAIGVKHRPLKVT